MRTHATRSVSGHLAIATLLALPLLVGSAGAQDADELAKQASAQLRKAQSSFFSGKAEQALELLEAGEALVEQLQAKDSAHKKLSSLQNQAKRLRRDVERKLGKNQPEQPEEPAKEAPPDQPSGDAGAKLPYPVEQALKAFDRAFRSAEENIASFDASDPEQAASKVKRIEGNIKYAQSKLKVAQDEAQKRGAAEHPALAAAAQKVADAEKQLTLLRQQAEGAAGAAAERAEGATGDAEVLMKLRDHLRDNYKNKAEGLRYEAYQIEKARECLTIIQDFEQRDLEGARQALADFGAKYGTTKAEIDEKTSAAGYHGGQAGWAYEGIAETIQVMHDLRSIVAEELLKRTEERMSNLSGISDLVKIEYLLETKEFVLTAAEFDPGSEKVKAALADIDPRVQKYIEGFYEKIDKVKWEGHAADAPGDADALAEAAEEWFRTSKDWGQRKTAPYTILDVKVTGPWSVQKTDLLGRTIMYGLPIRLAVQLASEKDTDLARAFNLTLRTHEGLDAKKAPPFWYPTVGGNWYVRASKVK